MENKKTKKADLNNKSSLFFSVSLCITLSIVLMAFEWKSYQEGDLMDLGNVTDDFEELLEIPIIEHPPPPPPKITQPEIIEVPDEEEIEDEIEVDLDVEINEETIIEDFFESEPEEEEVADEIILFPEQQPEFPGGVSAFYSYVSKTFRYPPQARRMQIEGKVFVQFVIDRDGNISDVVVLKGIGAGCDDEAVRVIKNSPKWNPGKQRGVAVRVRMVLPITFKLN